GGGGGAGGVPAAGDLVRRELRVAGRGAGDAGAGARGSHAVGLAADPAAGGRLGAAARGDAGADRAGVRRVLYAGRDCPDRVFAGARVGGRGGGGGGGAVGDDPRVAVAAVAAAAEVRPGDGVEPDGGDAHGCVGDADLPGHRGRVSDGDGDRPDR